MGVTHGVAGVPGFSLSPEVSGIFLCRDEWEVAWFGEMATSQGHGSLDVWEVELPADAPLIEHDESGYEYCPQPIAPSAIRLVRPDWSPEAPSGD